MPPSSLGGVGSTAWDPALGVTVFAVYTPLPAPDVSTPWLWAAETWEWDGTHWREAQVQTTGPDVTGGRIDGDLHWFQLVYDPASRTVLDYLAFDGAYGGMDDQKVDETFTWDGVNWTQRAVSVNNPPGTPPWSLQAWQISEDPATNATVMLASDLTNSGHAFTGTCSTWIWDGTSWRQQHPTTTPPCELTPSEQGRAGAAMAYDAALGKVVLFGGTTLSGPPSSWTQYDDTWLWDGTDWSQVSTPVAPPARLFAKTAGTPDGSVLLYGGVTYYPDPTWSGGYGLLTWNDAWSFDGARWTAIPATGAPNSQDDYLETMADGPSGQPMLFGTWNLDVFMWDTGIAPGTVVAEFPWAPVAPGAAVAVMALVAGRRRRRRGAQAQRGRS